MDNCKPSTKDCVEFYLVYILELLQLMTKSPLVVSMMYDDVVFGPFSKALAEGKLFPQAKGQDPLSCWSFHSLQPYPWHLLKKKDA